MKKAAVLALFVLFVSSVGYAETTKDVVHKVGNFWSKEAERSGLKESTSSWASLFKNINPGKFFKDQQDSYKARQTGAASGTIVK